MRVMYKSVWNKFGKYIILKFGLKVRINHDKKWKWLM